MLIPNRAEPVNYHYHPYIYTGNYINRPYGLSLPQANWNLGWLASEITGISVLMTYLKFYTSHFKTGIRLVLASSDRNEE